MFADVLGVERAAYGDGKVNNTVYPVPYRPPVHRVEVSAELVVRKVPHIFLSKARSD